MEVVYLEGKYRANGRVYAPGEVIDLSEAQVRQALRERIPIKPADTVEADRLERLRNRPVLAQQTRVSVADEFEAFKRGEVAVVEPVTLVPSDNPESGTPVDDAAGEKSKTTGSKDKK